MPINLPQTFLDEDDVPVYFYQLDSIYKRCAAAMLASYASCSGPSVVSRYLGSMARTASVTAPQTFLKAFRGATGSKIPIVQTVADFAFLTTQNAHDFAWSDAYRSVLEGFTRHPDLVGTLLSRDVTSSVVQLANQQVFSRLSGNGLTWFIETTKSLQTGALTFFAEFRRVLAEHK